MFSNHKQTSLLLNVAIFVGIAIGVKILFSDDVNLRAANVEVDLKRQQLSTANQAAKIKMSNQQLLEITSRLKEQQQAYEELYEKYEQLEAIRLDLPPADNFAIKETVNLDEIEEDLKETDERLVEEIKEVTDNIDE